jgi:hypothetical protein
MIGFFGFCCADSGPAGATSWSSSNQKPLSAGLEQGFDYFGAFDHDPKILADP